MGPDVARASYPPKNEMLLADIFELIYTHFDGHVLQFRQGKSGGGPLTSKTFESN